MARSGSFGPPILERVLVLVSGARDRELTSTLLMREGLTAVSCRGVGEFCAKVEEGAGLALVAEEMLDAAAVRAISDVLDRQPAWSDFPIVVFSAMHDRRTRSSARLLGNVTFLDRPVQVRSMLASVHASIRSRRRQYDGRRAIESRDEFLAMLGHELRNPLGAIRLASSNLSKQAPELKKRKDYQVVDRQSRHLARLVDDLLDVARISHGKVVLERERLNFADVVRNAFDALESRARGDGLSYELHIGDPRITVEGDRRRLEQVIGNLLTNAIKYTSPGGSVTVSALAEGDAAVAVVTDTGVGLAPEMLERVFDPFAQVSTSLDRAQGGMGLGLALVRNLVQLHGGAVQASSEGLGRGCAFTVRLPRLVDAVPDTTSTSSPGEHPNAKRVLVVEDNADNREMMTELLRYAGHEVECAESGPQGLEKLLALAPDIAFVDLGLPGFDGLELARRARARGVSTRLVALTGYGQAEDKKSAADAGFDEHMTKPVSDRDIERAIAH